MRRAYHGDCGLAKPPLAAFLPRLCNDSVRVIFANQLFVCDAAPGHVLENFYKSLCVCALALIKPKSLFIEIPEEMKRLDTDVGAFIPRFSKLQKFSMRFVWTLPLT